MCVDRQAQPEGFDANSSQHKCDSCSIHEERHSCHYDNPSGYQEQESGELHRRQFTQQASARFPEMGNRSGIGKSAQLKRRLVYG